MAKQKHLDLIRRGVEAWNEWRHESRSEQPDLSGAHLRGAHLTDADLIGANLSRADLSEADLREANLRGANLRGSQLTNADLIGANLNRAELRGAHLSEAGFMEADLRGAHLTKADLREAHLVAANLIEADLDGANLRGANLGGANLIEANVIEADLMGADLRGANLTKADLLGANLTKADLRGAILFETIFAKTNLSEAKGLDSCLHFGPSIIDHRTLGISAPPLPLAFLRGCGLPDSLIEYHPSLLNQPNQFYSCFISYSTDDQEFAERLHADLQSHGVRCWFAPYDIKSGRKSHVQLDEAIHVYDRLLLILSEHSMESERAKTEIAHARQKELKEQRRILFPISLVPFSRIHQWKCFDAAPGKVSACEIRECFVHDFSKWKDHNAYKERYHRLVEDLKAS